MAMSMDELKAFYLSCYPGMSIPRSVVDENIEWYMGQYPLFERAVETGNRDSYSSREIKIFDAVGKYLSRPKIKARNLPEWF